MEFVRQETRDSLWDEACVDTEGNGEDVNAKDGDDVGSVALSDVLDNREEAGEEDAALLASTEKESGVDGVGLGRAEIPHACSSTVGGLLGSDDSLAKPRNGDGTFELEHIVVVVADITSDCVSGMVVPTRP